MYAFPPPPPPMFLRLSGVTNISQLCDKQRPLYLPVILGQRYLPYPPFVPGSNSMISKPNSPASSFLMFHIANSSNLISLCLLSQVKSLSHNSLSYSQCSVPPIIDAVQRIRDGIDYAVATVDSTLTKNEIGTVHNYVGYLALLLPLYKSVDFKINSSLPKPSPVGVFFAGCNMSRLWEAVMDVRSWRR